ncbi:MAG: hypothetical protein A3H97_18675 [Acidobacteria bacterium RIFCSPLOWO2_02_FULL_65_29]|nr:MAG: hypothetical protein A3H97_18675 [Acidobacteria bacterium RIFCSPLOWO2_02_FULL_65_29]
MHVRLIVTTLFVITTSMSAQQPPEGTARSAGTSAELAPPTPAEAAAIAEVLSFEKTMEEAVVRGDVAFLATILPADFRFTHGDGWTSGGAPLRVDNKEAWLAAVGKRPYLTRDLDAVNVELHGDIAITYGRYKMKQTSSPNRGDTSVWFERVYAKRNGKWMYLSHRTVHGPLRDEGQASTSAR